MQIFTIFKFTLFLWKCGIFLFILILLSSVAEVKGVDTPQILREASLVFKDDHVAVYYNNASVPLTWPFSPLSRAWAYVKNIYGPFGDNPRLHVIIRFDNQRLNTGCRISASYLDQKLDGLNGIDCAEAKPTTEITKSIFFSRIITSFGHIIRLAANRILNNADTNICGNYMQEILSYDVYRFLNDPTGLLGEWEKEKLKESRNGTFWFRDWFLPIYNNYGRSRVLFNFYKIAYQHCQRNRTHFTHELNAGEFIYFWSEAAGTDLSLLALKAFKNIPFHNELIQARKDYLVVKIISRTLTAVPTTTASTTAVPVTTVLTTLRTKIPKIRRPSRRKTTFLPNKQGGKLKPTQSEDVPKPEDVHADVGSTNNYLVVVVMPVAFVLILISVIATACIIYRKNVRKLQDKLRDLTDDEIQTFFKGKLGADQNSSGYGFVESQPFSKEYEIAGDQLQIFPKRKLGSGAFGLVLRGMLKGSVERECGTADEISVAVKTSKPNVEVSMFLALLTEIKVMCFVGQHPHIVLLYGAKTANIRQREVHIAMEFCANGDLLNFLKTHQAEFKDFIGETATTVSNLDSGSATTSALYANGVSTISVTEPSNLYSNMTVNTNKPSLMSTLDLIKWSQQISSGMEFLGSKNVIHGDLGARNVLLTADKNAKISDFGFSRQLQNYSTYMKKTKAKHKPQKKTVLPWKWMAIESLRDMEFSVQSDIWSFGVTLFEIFSLGAIPYPGKNWTNEFLDDLVAGMRLKAPKFGNDEIFNLMMDCMKLEPSERIKFQELSYRLLAILKNIELNLNPESLSNYIVT